MIKFEQTEVTGFEAAIRGMRNPLNSWDKSDSRYTTDDFDMEDYVIGNNDLELMKKLCKAGSDHRKFMRMINVTVDITAPLYWWKEFDTYKVGTVANSCSTMHTITNKEFVLDDFSHEHLMSLDNSNYLEEDDDNACFIEPSIDSIPRMAVYTPEDVLNMFTIPMLNIARVKFLRTKDKKFWWQIIQLLPSSYNQKRTVQLNYEVLANIYDSRRGHKLDEWSIGFCDWIKTLPYFESLLGRK